MEKLFGTDGVRGIPGKAPLLSETIREIAFIAARIMQRRSQARSNGHAPAILMGRDTRNSGPEICRHLVSGFNLAKCRAVDLGVLPTPAVSYLTPRLKAVCGVVVSASHNPAQFNGIKFFDAAGFKMDPQTEELIESELRSRQHGVHPPKSRALPLNSENGSRYVAEYLDFLKSTFPPTMDLSGMRLAVDCAHGASSGIAPRLFRELGATVISLGCSPNGRNINDGCGALCTEPLRKLVLRQKAHCGVCFDGDADRAIFIDEKGRELDGDALICLSAQRLQRHGLLKSNKVALTVMSNFGLLKFLKERGISAVSVPVGDRNVTEAIEKEGLSLGGESSGHIIFRKFSATGDGMLTALQTLAALREAGKPLSELRRGFRAVPQVLKNLAVENKVPLEGLPHFRQLAGRFERELKGEGRIFLRYSGTEPLLRIMIEGPSHSRIRSMASALAAVYLKETGQRHEVH
ncbi:MAG: phosphoglucosamine mutase [Elusimicrobia bacterium]|nr:phosphoglucosamine mutase [Elusimicrobiota bacterium]